MDDSWLLGPCLDYAMVVVDVLAVIAVIVVNTKIDIRTAHGRRSPHRV